MEGNEQMITTEHLPIESAEEFIGLFGFREENLSMFREEMDVEIQANSSEILLTGEPEKVALHGDIEQLALDTWMNLNEDNKVSLYVSYISLADGSSDTIIINKHDQEEEA